jgi:hypothetical protein
VRREHSLVGPFLLAVAQRASGQPNASEVTVVNVVEEFLRLPAGVLSPPLAVPFAIAALALAAAGFVLGWFRGGRIRRSAVLAAVWLLVPPISLGVFQVATGSPGLVARYWVISMAPIAIGAALRSRRSGHEAAVSRH